MRYLLPAIALLIICTTAAAQAPTAKEIKANELPANIKVRGVIKQIWKWTDQSGDNLLVLSSTSPKKVKLAGSIEEGYTIELLATHFISVHDSAYRALWTMSDAVKECPLDYSAGFIKGATAITDLDKDGTAETTVQYQLSCHGDVSPASMKLIMHEGSTKFALRGTRWLDAALPEVKFNINEKNVNIGALSKAEREQLEQNGVLEFGRYENEKDFANAPAAFITHARKQWLRFVKE